LLRPVNPPSPLANTIRTGCGFGATGVTSTRSTLRLPAVIFSLRAVYTNGLSAS
jgi:hypothetical protein